MYLSSLLGAPSLKAPTDLKLGEPLPHQQPNQPLTHPKTLPFGGNSFQNTPPIRVYPQFPKAFPDLRADYQRVTEQFACALNEPSDLHGLVEP